MECKVDFLVFCSGELEGMISFCDCLLLYMGDISLVLFIQLFDYSLGMVRSCALYRDIFIRLGLAAISFTT